MMWCIRCADENNPLQIDIMNYLLMTSNVLYMKGNPDITQYNIPLTTFLLAGMITDPWNLPNIRSIVMRYVQLLD